ncbi:hypothetical protein G6F22_013282 [Rhizopus arrhizus]|nr:hypothetical protein G6F22_013282 [Rhizopus arrhizus]
MCQHKKDTRETNHGTIHPSRRAAQRREKAVVDRCSRRRPGVPDDRRAGAGGVRLPVQAVARRHPLSAGWPHRYRRPHRRSGLGRQAGAISGHRQPARRQRHDRRRHGGQGGAGRLCAAGQRVGPTGESRLVREHGA